MEGRHEDAVLDRFAHEPVANAVQKMKGLSEEFASRPIETFAAFTTQLWFQARDELVRIAAVNNRTELDSGLFVQALGIFISKLNGCLAAQYPYILALAEITGDGPCVMFIAMRRAAIPGAHDMLETSSPLVPIIRVSNIGQLHDLPRHIKNATYEGGPDDLSHLEF